MIGLLVCLTVCLSCSKDDGVLGQLDEALSNYHQYVSQKEDVLDGLKENMQNAQSKKRTSHGACPLVDSADSRCPSQGSLAVVSQYERRRTIPVAAPCQRLLRAAPAILHPDGQPRRDLPHGTSVRPLTTLWHQIYVVTRAVFGRFQDYIDRDTSLKP